MSASPEGRSILPALYLSTMGMWGAYALIVVVLPFRFAALGLSVFEYGVALAIYALGTLVTEGVWGYLAFRVGSRRVIVALAVITAASMLFLGLPQSFLGLALALGVYGMLVVYSTPLIRWVGMTASGPGTASRSLGRLGLFFGVGLTLGTAFGPVLYSLGGFWWNVLIGTAVFIVSTVPLARIPWDQIALPRERDSSGTSLRRILDRKFSLTVLLVVLYFVIYSLVTSFLQYYSVNLFHGSIDAAGVVIGMARAVALVSGVLLGSMIDRWGAARSAPVGFLLLSAGAFGTLVSVTYGEMILATVILATGAGWLSVNLLPLALSRIPRGDQGTAVGVFGSFEDLGLILGPLLLGGLYAGFGPRDTFLVTALVAVGATVIALTARWKDSSPEPALTPSPPAIGHHP